MIKLTIHRPPMKSILIAIVRKYALHTALAALNEHDGTDFTEADVIQWEHITQEQAIEHVEMVKRGGMMPPKTSDNHPS